MDRRLILIFVAFHPSDLEVRALMDCLGRLPATIGYAIAANDYHPGEPVEALFPRADLFICHEKNIGYGKAVNAVASRLPEHVPYIAALNTDLIWESGTFETIVSWLDDQPRHVLAVPRIVDPSGHEQHLCKQDPTVLALLSRRFLPEYLKPAWLKQYDRWFSMMDSDYSSLFSVPYLSGCCMVIRHAAFRSVAGFDERYFLYLEDADLTRKLRHVGEAVHVPFARVTHAWGRGNHNSLRLTLVNLMSAVTYFSKWGWTLF